MYTYCKRCGYELRTHEPCPRCERDKATLCMFVRFMTISVIVIALIVWTFPH